MPIWRQHVRRRPAAAGLVLVLVVARLELVGEVWIPEGASVLVRLVGGQPVGRPAGEARRPLVAGAVRLEQVQRAGRAAGRLPALGLGVVAGEAERERRLGRQRRGARRQGQAAPAGRVFALEVFAVGHQICRVMGRQVG